MFKSPPPFSFMFVRTFLLATALLSVATAHAAEAFAPAQPGLAKQEAVTENPPFAECHASTVLPLKDDGLLVSYFAGTKEGNPDVGIWISRYENGQWSAPVEIANGEPTPQNVQAGAPNERVASWNPVLFRMKDGSIALFYKLGTHPKTWWGMRINSTDEGKTWSQPERLPDGIYGPIKNKPVYLADGTLLCPTSIEDKDGWRVYFESSKDEGKTWQKTACVPAGKGIKAIQPSVLFHPNGVLQAVGRTGHGASGGFVYQTFSSDNGQTWTPLTATPLPNNNSGTDAVTLKDGTHLLIYNHMLGRARSPLNVAISPDGARWYGVLQLENTPGGEFSYPAIIQAEDGTVHAVYTWNRKKIRHAVIDPKALKKGPLLTSTWEGWPNPVWEKKKQ